MSEIGYCPHHDTQYISEHCVFCVREEQLERNSTMLALLLNEDLLDG